MLPLLSSSKYKAPEGDSVHHVIDPKPDYRGKAA